MEAADRVDSTCGLQMAYLKSGRRAAHRACGCACRRRAGPGAARHRGSTRSTPPALVGADLVYLDPPYNQHTYLGNYHVWESLVRWDKPDVYGIA